MVGDGVGGDAEDVEVGAGGVDGECVDSECADFDVGEVDVPEGKSGEVDASVHVAEGEEGVGVAGDLVAEGCECLCADGEGVDVDTCVGECAPNGQLDFAEADVAVDVFSGGVADDGGETRGGEYPRSEAQDDGYQGYQRPDGPCGNFCDAQPDVSFAFCHVKSIYFTKIRLFLIENYKWRIENGLRVSMPNF